uniref:Uncharacterized protein n=1 Tax=Cucumis melo TaxID=3656 RepID=A0A9I9EFD5_CUCME
MKQKGHFIIHKMEEREVEKLAHFDQGSLRFVQKGSRGAQNEHARRCDGSQNAVWANDRLQSKNK